MNEIINWIICAGGIVFVLGMMWLLISVAFSIVWQADDDKITDEDYQEAQKFLDLLRGRRGK